MAGLSILAVVHHQFQFSTSQVGHLDQQKIGVARFLSRSFRFHSRSGTFYFQLAMESGEFRLHFFFLSRHQFNSIHISSQVFPVIKGYHMENPACILYLDGMKSHKAKQPYMMKLIAYTLAKNKLLRACLVSQTRHQESNYLPSLSSNSLSVWANASRYQGITCAAQCSSHLQDFHVERHMSHLQDFRAEQRTSRHPGCLQLGSVCSYYMVRLFLLCWFGNLCGYGEVCLLGEEERQGERRYLQMSKDPGKREGEGLEK